MLLHPERGFGCALLLWMENQPLGCCFDGFVLCLRLLVASVPCSPADGACLALDQVVHCSSASGAECRVLASGGPLLVPGSLYSPATENLSFFLGSFEVVDGVFFFPLLVAPSLEAPQRVRPSSAGDHYLSGLRAGGCGLPLRRRVHARVWLVACPPLLREWRTTTSLYP